jgi:GAF domain-containing protein
LDRQGVVLRGIVSEWDWTRTSFASNLCDWPTVERALADGKAHIIRRASAIAAEAAWFEPRGIACTICVPLRAKDRPLGVLFFDFDSPVTEIETDLAFLSDVGRRSARALARSCSLPGDAEAIAFVK